MLRILTESDSQGARDKLSLVPRISLPFNLNLFPIYNDMKGERGQLNLERELVITGLKSNSI